MSFLQNESDVSSGYNGQVHFTYKNPPDMHSLCQGDLLKITDSIRGILKDIHPYFLNEQYKYFMVLTQSCDLVRRNGSKCKTPYITLAAVRDFDTFFEDYLIKDKCAEKVNDILLMDSKKRDRAYQFLERLYNNTEPDYFFLYREAALSFPNSMVVTLKVSIALKSELHYDACLAAKVLELSDEFKAKLGWLVGNIYSRVGTTDWESIMTSSERSEMLSNELSSHCVIASKEQITELKNKINSTDTSIHSIQDAADFIKSVPVETKYNQAISAIEQIINTSGKSIPAEVRTSLITRIRSNSKLKVLIPK